MRAERIIEALHDMAESLKAMRRPDMGEARAAVSQPPRLIQSCDGHPDRPGSGTGGRCFEVLTHRQGPAIPQDTRTCLELYS